GDWLRMTIRREQAQHALDQLLAEILYTMFVCYPTRFLLGHHVSSPFLRLDAWWHRLEDCSIIPGDPSIAPEGDADILDEVAAAGQRHSSAYGALFNPGLPRMIVKPLGYGQGAVMGPEWRIE